MVRDTKRRRQSFVWTSVVVHVRKTALRYRRSTEVRNFKKDFYDGCKDKNNNRSRSSSNSYSGDTNDIRGGIFSKLPCRLTNTSRGHNARNFSFLKTSGRNKISRCRECGILIFNWLKIRHASCGMSNLSLATKFFFKSFTFFDSDSIVLFCTANHTESFIRVCKYAELLNSVEKLCTMGRIKSRIFRASDFM